MRSLSFLVPVVLSLVACGGGQSAPATPPPPPPVEAPVTALFDAGPENADTSSAPVDSGVMAATDAAPAQKAWPDMSHEERLALMKTTVFPQMKKAFQDFDAKDYADFTCATCHGPDIKKGKFDMPNPKLPKLDAKDGFKKMAAKHPKAMQFMKDTVAPTMAQLLGVPAWSPTNMSGFGCANCHKME
jgi:cytochrome c553